MIMNKDGEASMLKGMWGSNKGDNASKSRSNALLCMDTAPLDGTPVLLKFKDDMSQFDKEDNFHTKELSGLYFVGRNRGDLMLWGFAAPVGYGGFPSDWLDGWMPLPT